MLGRENVFWRRGDLSYAENEEAKRGFVRREKRIRTIAGGVLLAGGIVGVGVGFTVGDQESLRSSYSQPSREQVASPKEGSDGRGWVVAGMLGSLLLGAYGAAGVLNGLTFKPQEDTVYGFDYMGSYVPQGERRRPGGAYMAGHRFSGQ